MIGISLEEALLFIGTTLFQLLGASLAPASQGMTRPWPSIGVLASYAIGVTLMARLINSGVSLSLLVPLLTLSITLGAVAVGVLVYGESASTVKLVLLGLATVFICLASRY